MSTTRNMGIRVKTQKPSEERQERDPRSLLQVDIPEHECKIREQIVQECTFSRYFRQSIGNKTTQNPSEILTVIMLEPGWDGKRRFSGATAISVIVRPVIAASTTGQRPDGPSRGWIRPSRCPAVRSRRSSR